MEGRLHTDAYRIIADALQAGEHGSESLTEALRVASAQISPVSASLSSRTICQECGHSADDQAIQCSVLEIEPPASDIDPLTASYEDYAAALSEAAYYTRILILPPDGSPVFNFRLLSDKLSASYLQTSITTTLRLPPDTTLAALSIDKEVIGLTDIFTIEDDGDQDRSSNLERYCRLNFGANHCLIIVPMLPEEIPEHNRRDVLVDIFVADSPENISIPLVVDSDELDTIAETIRKRLALFYSDGIVRDSVLSPSTILSLTPTTEYSFKCVVSFDSSIDRSARSCDFCAVLRSSPRVIPTVKHTLTDCIENTLKETIDPTLVCPNCRARGSVVLQKTLLSLGKVLPVLILNTTSCVLLQDTVAFDSVQHTVALAVLQASSGELAVALNVKNQAWSINGEARSIAELQHLSCVFFISVEKQVLQED